MQTYIQSILYISIFVVIVELILPSSSLKKFITVIVSLVIIITIISPIYNFATEDVMEALENAINTLSSPDKFSDIMEDSDIDISKYNSKSILSRYKTSLEETILQSLSVELKDKAKVEEVNIVLNNNSQIQEIKVYISNIKTDTTQNITNILDSITSKYNVPKNLLTIIKR